MPANHHTDPRRDQRMKGVVVSLTGDGFGYIKVDVLDELIGFRQRDVPGGRPLVEGQSATCKMKRTDRGKLRAFDIEPGRVHTSPWITYSALGLAAAAAVTIAAGVGLGLDRAIFWLLVWLMAINITVLVFYRLDKAMAEAGGSRRIAERALHVIELAGGSLAVPFARKKFHHKTRPEKREFRAMSWAILALHLSLACAAAWYFLIR